MKYNQSIDLKTVKAMILQLLKLTMEVISKQNQKILKFITIVADNWLFQF